MLTSRFYHHRSFFPVLILLGVDLVAGDREFFSTPTASFMLTSRFYHHRSFFPALILLGVDLVTDGRDFFQRRLPVLC
jgi:hypothetical protein